MSRLLLVLLFAGCSGGGASVDVTGAIGSSDFTGAVAYNGGPYIVIFDRPVDCIDISWVHKIYTDGSSPAEGLDFVGLQLTWQSLEPSVGTNDVAGNGEVSAQGLINEGGTFTLEKGRSGTVSVSEVGADNEYVTGSLSLISFATGTLTGDFTTEYCRNLVP